MFEEGVASLVDIWIERVIEYRSRQTSPKNVFDVQYTDLMKDPIGTVRRIYDHFDLLQWSDEYEEAMRIWLIDNPQGKQGRNSYSLAEFGCEAHMSK